MNDLFAADTAAGSDRPLADRMRPASLAEFSGQRHLLEPGKPLVVISDLQAQLITQQGQLLTQLLVDATLVAGTTLHRLQVNPDTIQLSLKVGLVASQRLDVRTHAAGSIRLNFLE